MREAPRPKAPSRSEPGTEVSASSATVAIVGSTSTPSTRPADSALKEPTSMPRPLRMVGVTKVSAK